MITAPDIRATPSVEAPSNTERIIGSLLASSIPAHRPRNIPRPPQRGMAWSWTSRSRTPATAPARRASERTTGMTR